MFHIDPTIASVTLGLAATAIGLAAVMRRPVKHSISTQYSALDLIAATRPEPSLVGRAVDVGAVLIVVTLLGSVGYVGLYPVFAPRHPDIGKITLRVVGQGDLPAREARR